MEKDQIFINDIKRILLGNAPPEFLLEVLIRTLLIYVAVLFVVKLLGKRMSGQVTTIEMAILIMLGAIIGSPVQIPDRGILVGLLVLFCTVLFQRFVNMLSYKNESVERLVLGNASLLVKNGVLKVKEMAGSRVSAQQVFSLLRAKEIRQLGEVKRVYLEACGIFSVYKNPTPTEGLPILPPEDRKIFKEIIKNNDIVACQRCGYTTNQSQSASRCPVCGNETWVAAIK